MLLLAYTPVDWVECGGGEDECEVGREGFVGWCERHAEPGAGCISMKVGTPCEGDLLLLSCSLHLYYRKREDCTMFVHAC